MFETSPLLKVSLNTHYRDIARREFNQLTMEQSARLAENKNACWDQAVVLAWLHRIDERMTETGMPRNSLGKYFPVLDESTFSKWFSVGEIKGKHFATLANLDEFAGLRPSPEILSFHGWRQGIGWVRDCVLRARKRVSPIKADELLFMIHLHSVDEPDIQLAFTQLPEPLLRRYPNHSSEWDAKTEVVWGTSYRLFIMEMCDEI